jgi:hypothetical protein
MRKSAAILAATVGVTLAAAGSASADVPDAKVQTFSSATQTYQVCDTPYSYGVAFQYGAWGDYVDGCTVRLTCPATARRACRVVSDASFTSLVFDRYSKVTQNARLRVFPTATSNSPIWWRDRSCSDPYSYCESTDTAHISPGQSASTQCNGVREHYAGAPQATNACYITMLY